MSEQKMTGYPSIDKPWLKYYSKQAILNPLPCCTMYQYVFDNNKDNMDGIAYEYMGSKIKFEHFFSSVKEVAASLTAMGISEGDIVTIMSLHTPETIYLIYGLNYIGAISNLIYMTSLPSDIVDKIETTNSKALFILDVAVDKLESVHQMIKVPIVVMSVFDSIPKFKKLLIHIMGKKISHRYKSFYEFLKNKKEPTLTTMHNSPAIIVYTSGSTGKPKGVVLSNNAMNAHSFQLINAEFHFERNKTFLFILPPFIGFGISHIHAALNSGTTCYLWLDLDPDKIVKEFMRIKPNYFCGGPAFAEAFLRSKVCKLPDLSLFVGGGGALPQKVEEQMNDFLQQCNPGTKYSNGYGMTETSSTLCGSTNELYRKGSVGLPMPRTNIKVVDVDTQKELGFNEVGELWISTPSMMDGYYNDLVSTDEIIVIDCNKEKWIRTGDLGCVDLDGFVYIKGRIKRIYITKDKDGMALKLFPKKIEELILENSNVEKCGVIVVEDEIRMNVAIVFVKLLDDTVDNDVQVNDLWELCNRNLSEYELHIGINIIDEMPLTPSGKIDYKLLEEKANIL